MIIGTDSMFRGLEEYLDANIGTDSRFRGLEEYLDAYPISSSFHSIVNATPGGTLKHVHNIQLKSSFSYQRK